jgi:hypothetical protein
MKTNVIVKSEDRNLFGITIQQQTKTGLLNLSDLQEAYTHARVKNGWTDKRVDRVLLSEQNKERVYYVLKEQGVINVSFQTFMQGADTNYIKYLKKLGVYKTTGARNTKTTWCDPYIWILVALELSPVFYAKTVIWLKDSLILNRIEAGNFYKTLGSALQKFKPDGEQYRILAKALNYIVFRKHETGIRNTGTKEQLKELTRLEEKFAFAIDMGYIKTFDDLLAELRKMYNEKIK